MSSVKVNVCRHVVENIEFFSPQSSQRLLQLCFAFFVNFAVNYWNTDRADDADLHVWREPYVWATSTGATVDADTHGYDFPEYDYPCESVRSVSSVFYSN